MQLADFSEKDKRIWQLCKTVPKMTSPWQYIAFLLNLFIPGTGTLLSSCWANPCSKSQAVIAVLQFITTMYIVGWLWSVVWGCIIVSTANDGADVTTLLNQTAARSDDPQGMPQPPADEQKMYKGYNVGASKSFEKGGPDAGKKVDWSEGYMI